MAISEEMFREVFRRWPSGVAVVTTCLAGRAHGMVVGSLCSLSADPPLVMFSAGQSSRTRALVDSAGIFAASILAAEQTALFERFTGRDPAHDDDRFTGLTVAIGVTGAPVFPEALAWIDCQVVARHPGSTYTIFVGEVLAAGLGGVADAAPLIYFQRQRRQLLPQWS